MVKAYKEIQLEVADGIATLTLNRPDKLNAFTGTMMFEMIDALDYTDASDDVKVVIVTGAGKAFCAGADLSAGAKTFDYEARGEDASGKPSDSPVRADGSIDWSHEGVRDGGGLLTLRMYDSLKPIIGAINGAGVGMGATMQLPMDVRIASDKARFGFVFARRGIVPDACCSWFLPRVVGISKALEWCTTGRIFSADEALAAGLVSKVVAHETLLDEAKALAREIIDNTAPVSVTLTRQLLWRLLGSEHPMDAHKLDSRAIYARGRQGDAREGVMSFLEKRQPNYPDKVSTDMPDFYPWWTQPTYE